MKFKMYKIVFEILAEEGQDFINDNVADALKSIIATMHHVKEAKFIDENEK